MNGTLDSFDMESASQTGTNSDVDDEEIEGISPEMEQELIWMRNIMDIINRIPTMSREEKASLQPMINEHIAKNPRYREEIERNAEVLRKRNGGAIGHNITIPSSRDILRELYGKGPVKNDVRNSPEIPEQIIVKEEIFDVPITPTVDEANESERLLEAGSKQALVESEKTKALVVDITMEPSIDVPSAGLLMVSEKQSEEQKEDVISPASVDKSPVRESADVKMEIDDVASENPPTPSKEECPEEPAPKAPVKPTKPAFKQEVKVEEQPESLPEEVSVAAPETEPEPVPEPQPEPVVVQKEPTPERAKSDVSPVRLKSPQAPPAPPVEQTPQPETTPKPADPEKKTRPRGRPRKVKEEPKAAEPVPPATPATPVPPSTSTHTTPTDVKEQRRRRRSERARTASTASSVVSQTAMATRGSTRHKAEVKAEPVDSEASAELDTSAETTTSVEGEKVEADQSSDILSVADPPKSAPVEAAKEEDVEMREETQRPVIRKRKIPYKGGIGCQTVLSLRPPLIAKDERVIIEFPKSRCVGRAPYKNTQTDKVRISETDQIEMGIHNPIKDKRLFCSEDESSTGSRPGERSSGRKSKDWRVEPVSEGSESRMLTVNEMKNIKTEPTSDIDEVPSGNGITNPALLQRHMCISIVNSIAAQRCAAPFLHPVTDRVAPGYKDVILNPVDINTLKKMVDSSKISRVFDLKKSIANMYANAVMYNYNNHEVNMHAKSESTDAFNHIEEILKLTSDEGSQGRRRPTTRANNEVRATASSSSRTTPVQTPTAQQLTPQAPAESIATGKSRRSVRSKVKE